MNNPISHPPTPEQTAILSLAACSDHNLMIDALAGCGKTSTLEMLEPVLACNILYMAFNKKVADEAATRMAGTTVCRTFNGLGHRIWQAAQVSRLALDPKKIQNLFKALIDESPKSAQGEMWSVYWDVVQAVNLARALGYVPENKYPQARRLLTQGQFHAALDEVPDDFTSDLIEAILTRCIKAAYSGQIDFNDQIYMPALFGGTFPNFPVVLVDEYQDLSPVNHAMLDKLARQRIIGVGDPWQNIYGFRGAQSDGMSAARAKFSMTTAPLSTSFRCPRAIVENARWRVPHFNWFKDGGHVEQLHSMSSRDFPIQSTIISRNNAPLFSCALRLLAAGYSVSVGGSEIGPKLVGILKRLGTGDESQETTLNLIDDWEEVRLAKESKSAPDLAECMRVFARATASLSQAIAYAEHLFKQSGSIKLMTGHKAKGQEFDTVYHLDPDLLDLRSEQDKNLYYVIQTRSKDKYFEIHSRDIRW